MGSPEQVTTVTIFNRVYHVRSGNDPAYVRELARLVDRKMFELSQNTPTVDTLKVAILAALNIADDLLGAQKELERIQETTSLRSEKLAASVQDFLESEPT